jgi:hypothetical protein
MAGSMDDGEQLFEHRSCQQGRSHTSAGLQPSIS